MSKEESIDLSLYDKDKLRYENVREIYEKIADEFSVTRSNVWPCVKEFIRKIEKNEYVLEIGIGNGRNMRDIIGVKFGLDVCENFLGMNREINCVKADQIILPYRDESFDVILSVAVFHHLLDDEERIKCANEMKRVLRTGGRIFLEVFERVGDQGGDMLRWRSKDGDYRRYYHRFGEEELKRYFGNVSVVKRECNNLIFIIEK